MLQKQMYLVGRGFASQLKLYMACVWSVYTRKPLLFKMYYVTNLSLVAWAICFRMLTCGVRGTVVILGKSDTLK